MNKTFKDFYSNFGLVDYPFSSFNAEDEIHIKGLFVYPFNFELIKEKFDKHRSVFIIGNRGTGKTAILQELQKGLGEDAIAYVVDDYSKLPINPSLNDYYQFFITIITYALMEKILKSKKKLSKLSHIEKLKLSFFVKYFFDGVTENNLNTTIAVIQVPFIKRITNLAFNKVFRKPLNYVGTSALNAWLASMSMPSIDDGNIKEILPEWKVGADKSFIGKDVSYSLLCDLLRIIKRLEFNTTRIFIDKIDEDIRLLNDADNIGSFIKPLLADNKLLLNQDCHFIISLWQVPFNFIKSEVRTQKLNCELLNWTNNDLKKVLNKRLQIFSNNNICCYTDLFDKNIGEEELNAILNLANSNPRDLWHIFDKIFVQQYSLDSETNKIMNDAVKSGMTEFVKTFNFYEYYPKKVKSRKNSMDIYSYIKHLLKLDSSTFSKNKLDEMAGTGGSTSNYVVGMENIGLLKKDEQKSGVVYYKITDAKVIFAQKYGIDISKD